MNFSEAVKSGFKKYFDTKGRASRSEYWYWVMFGVLGDQACQLLDSIIFRVPYGSVAVHPLDTAFLLVTLVPGITVSIRRLHDIGREWRWLLLALTGIGMIYPLLVWSCEKGTKGKNRFGKDPLEGIPPKNIGSQTLGM